MRPSPQRHCGCAVCAGVEFASWEAPAGHGPDAAPAWMPQACPVDGSAPGCVLHTGLTLRQTVETPGAMQALADSLAAADAEGNYRCRRCRRLWSAPGRGGQQVCVECLGRNPLDDLPTFAEMEASRLPYHEQLRIAALSDLRVRLRDLPMPLLIAPDRDAIQEYLHAEAELRIAGGTRSIRLDFAVAALVAAGLDVPAELRRATCRRLPIEPAAVPDALPVVRAPLGVTEAGLRARLAALSTASLRIELAPDAVPAAALEAELAGTLADLAAMVGIVQRAGGYLAPADQLALWAAKARLAALGGADPETRSDVKPGSESAQSGGRP